METVDMNLKPYNSAWWSNHKFYFNA